MEAVVLERDKDIGDWDKEYIVSNDAKEPETIWTSRGKIKLEENMIQVQERGATLNIQTDIQYEGCLLYTSHVLDMGTGTGIIPVLLKAKTPGGHFTGLEIQEECAELAQRSVAYNGLEQDIDIVCGDIKEAAEIFGAASFHAVTSNPPYMIGQHGLQNPYMAKAIARHEILCTLEDVVSQTAKVLKDRGRFYMVHRPFRLVEIFQVLTRYKPVSYTHLNKLGT